MAGTKNNIIDRRFVHFKNYDTFLQEINGEVDYVEDKLVYGNLKRNSIVWISDKLLVWTHGKFYPLFNLKGINELDLPEDLALQEDDGLLLALGKLLKRADNIDNILVNIPNNYIKIDGTNGTKEGLSTLIKKLDAGDADVTDTTSFITSHILGDAALPLYYRRSATYLLNYILSKSDPRYVNVTGDTMTGALTITTDTTQPLILKGHDTGSYVQFGKGGVGAEVGWYDGLGAYIQNDALSTTPTLCLDTNDLNSAKFRSGSTKYTIWHAGNDGPNSGLDADMLDGYHISNYQTGGWTSLIPYVYDETNGIRYYSYKLFSLNNINCTIRIRIYDDINYPSYSEWVLRVNNTDNYGKNVILTPTAVNSTNLRVYIDSSYGVWIQGFAQWNCSLEYRVEKGSLPTYSDRVIGAPSDVIQTIINCGNSRNGSTYSNYSFQANATSATKLQTARAIWGQNFDGTGNVRGDMTGVGAITASGRNTVQGAMLSNNTVWASDNGHFRAFSSATTNPYMLGFGVSEDGYGLIQSSQRNVGTIELLINPKGGNVGIGTTSPASKLDVNGNILSQGFVKNGSSDSYLLLGGGGHKAISDFVTSTSLGDYVTIATNLTITGLKTLGLKEGDTNNHEINRLAITPYGHTGGPWYINVYDTNTTAHLRIKYSTAASLTLTHTGELTAYKFVKSGGTSSQFLKADGSVDGNTYLTSHQSLDSTIRNYTYPTGTTYDVNNCAYNAVVHEYRWSNVPTSSSSNIASIFDLSYSNDWRTQIFARPAANTELLVRSRYSGTTWGDWAKILTSANTKIDGGVITINGTSITPLTSHQSLDYINVKDIRDTTPKPNKVASRRVTAWFNNNDRPSNTQVWYSGITVKGWTEDYAVWLLGANADNGQTDPNLYFRIGRNDTWNAWQTILTSANYTSHVTTLRDRSNGTATYLNYGAAGISNPSWLAAWSGYELRAISPANVLSCIGALPKSGGQVGNLELTTTDAEYHYIKIGNVNGENVILHNAAIPGYSGIRCATLSYYDDGSPIADFYIAKNGDLGYRYNGINNKVWHSGNDGSGSGLDADLLDGYHSYNFDVVRQATIDLSDLDPNTWYPVLFSLAVGAISDIKVKEASKAVWGTNGNAVDGKKQFWCTAHWQSSGNGWGAIDNERFIFQSESEWCGISAIGEIGQLAHSNNEYVYLRGGASYLCRATNCNNIFRVTTSTTFSGETIAPKTTSPKATRNAALMSDTITNADKLDGLHASSFVDRKVIGGQSTQSNKDLLQAYYSSLADSNAHAVRIESGPLHMAFGYFLNNPALNPYGGWFVAKYGSPEWVGVNNGVWVYEKFAFLSSNVASATKLNDDTEFKAWGKPFFKNGKPQNVSGDLTIDGKITGESIQIGDVEITPQMLGTGNQYKNDPIYNAAVRSSAIDVTLSTATPSGSDTPPESNLIGTACSIPLIILYHTNYGNVQPYAKWTEIISDRWYAKSGPLIDYPAFSGGTVIVHDISGKLSALGSGYYIYDPDAGTLTPVHFLDVIS